jgi:hypothetical protein
MQIELYSSPWRSGFERFLKGVHTDLLIASPFIKKSEADWVCSLVAGRSIHLSVLTDIRSDSVLNGSLDIDALKIFSHAAADSKVIALPGLHAKVYVRDKDFAIITSANLTPSGFQSNYEYGVGLSDPQVVYQIRQDLEAYGRVGSPMTPELMSELVAISEDLIEEYNEVQRSAKASIRKRFNQKLRKARIEFLRAQVGNRSAHALFSDAILYVLSKGPLKTAELHPRIQQLLPELCDDTVELIINGQRFGKRWKHAVRNAQQFLKRQGIIGFDGYRWSLIQ